MRYVKKRIPVEAVQWFKVGDHPAVVLADIEITPGFRDLFPIIHTLEGPHRVSKGDWIVTGIEGECWPVKPHIFEKTYEPYTE